MAFNRAKFFAIQKQYHNKFADTIPKDSGIYLWTREENGKTFFYVGQAKDLYNRRFNYYCIQTGLSYPTRLFEYSLKKHNDYNFQIIERCPIDKLDEREKYWIDYYFKLPNYITRNDCLTTGRDVVKSNYKRIENIQNRQRKAIEQCLSHLDVKIKPNDKVEIKVRYTKQGQPAIISVKYFNELLEILSLKGDKNEIQ